MVWFKVDDGFYSSRKVLSIPRRHRLAAVGLWAMAGNWSARELTDGKVPTYVLDELGATETLIRALVEAREDALLIDALLRRAFLADAEQREDAIVRDAKHPLHELAQGGGVNQGAVLRRRVGARDECQCGHARPIL